MKCVSQYSLTKFDIIKAFSVIMEVFASFS